MVIFFKRAIAVLALVCLIHSLTAKNLYISPNGDNNHNGSMSSPLATLQKATSLAKPGDSIFIRGGFYQIREPQHISCKGKSSQQILIMPYQGEEVVFDALDLHTPVNPNHGRHYHGGAIHFEGAQYVILKNITVRNSRAVGIMAKGKETSHITIERCQSHGSYGSGIALWYADQSRVIECVITGANDQSLRPNGAKVRREAPHEALTVAGATNFEIAYNELYNCFKEGIDCKEVSANGIIHSNYVYDLPRQGIYVDSWFGLLHDIEVFNNEVFQCEWGITLSAEGKDSQMKNIKIHHNLIHNNRGSGILFGVWGHDQVRENVEIYQNTVVNNGTSKHWAGVVGGIDIRSENLKNVIIRHNIVAYNHGFDLAGALENHHEKAIKKELKVYKNLITDSTALPQTSGEFPDIKAINNGKNIIGEPAFIDAENHNFRLWPRSDAFKNYWEIVPGFYGRPAYTQKKD